MRDIVFIDKTPRKKMVVMQIIENNGRYNYCPDLNPLEYERNGNIIIAVFNCMAKDGKHLYQFSDLIKENV